METDQFRMDGVECGEDEETEDEVTFLLRLRPTPSPPARRRRHSVDCRPTSQVLFMIVYIVRCLINWSYSVYFQVRLILYF